MSDDRDAEGKFQPGNTIWQARSTYGRDREYDDAESLWAACVEYFEWAHQNPLLEGVAYQGKVSTDGLPKLRAFTQKALCLHLRISGETWRTWRTTREDLAGVIQTVDDVIFTQKFEGAAAGLLNANIISRELGLADRRELTGQDGGPIQTTSPTDVELARRIAFILARAMSAQDTDQPNEKE